MIASKDCQTLSSIVPQTASRFFPRHEPPLFMNRKSVNPKTSMPRHFPEWIVVSLAVLCFGTPGWMANAMAQEAPAEEQQEQPGKPESGKVKAADDKTNEKVADGDKDTESGRSPSSRRRRPDVAKSSDQFLELFDTIVKDAREATVEIKSGNKTIALGAIVDASGFVLTKQSELKSPLSCVLHNGKTVSAIVYGVHPKTDLALLQVTGEDMGSLPVVSWSAPEALDVGSWLVTIKADDDPVVVGVVGVKERMIRPKPGFMGVNLGQQDSKVIVTNVNPDTPARQAGILVGDAIIDVNGEAVTDIPSLQEKVRSFAPGDEITLKILRKDKEIALDIVLGDAEDLNPLFERSNQQNTMGGNELSKRRQDFPLAVQHDGFLKPTDCGGPVVNIDGKVVGINIARQGRVSSLMLPTSVVLPVLAELKSGQRAPALVNKERIDEINRALQNLRTTVNLSATGSDEEKSNLEKLQQDEKKARTNLDKALQELDAAREARLRAEIGLQNASEKSDMANREIERLERELQQLVSGAK
jgi:serine protease Do